MSLGSMEQRTEGMKRHAQELIDQAYQRGYKAGRVSGLDDCIKTIDVNALVEQGRNEAWEAAKKFYSDFSYCHVDAIFTTYSASEAIEKLKEYEEQKKQEEEPKLKPCPFCGSTDIRIYRPAVEYYVRCHNCFVTKGEFDTEEEATDEWNKRAGEETGY